MTELPTLSLKRLAAAVAGGAAAFRSRTRLQPAGGPGDKVFPPTYATGDRTLRYAIEHRRIDGAEVATVLLDSVASQANRMEEALQRGWEEERLRFPLLAVDFSGCEGIADLTRLSALEVPHRIADALLRDSVTEDGTLFRDTELGHAYTGATAGDATAVYKACPTALVFGVWDSTGPRGGSGAKFARALVSEIVAIDAVTGAKVSSRIDPAGIQAGVRVYHREDDPDDWTVFEDEAQKKGNRPVLFRRKSSEGKAGRPSAVNHSNVTPSIDTFAGGITFDYALQTSVLSLPALRRLRFVRDVSGEPLRPETRQRAEGAARTALAALALAALAWHRRDGFDLRSRCALVPDGPHVLELVPADGGDTESFRLTADQAAELLDAAHEAASACGFGWEREPLRLRPAEKLADLIRKSRELAAAGAGDEEA